MRFWSSSCICIPLDRSSVLKCILFICRWHSIIHNFRAKWSFLNKFRRSLDIHPRISCSKNTVVVVQMLAPELKRVVLSLFHLLSSLRNEDVVLTTKPWLLTSMSNALVAPVVAIWGNIIYLSPTVSSAEMEMTFLGFKLFHTRFGMPHPRLKTKGDATYEVVTPRLPFKPGTGQRPKGSSRKVNSD